MLSPVQGVPLGVHASIRCTQTPVGALHPLTRILEHMQIDIIDTYTVPDRLEYKYALVFVDK